MSTPKVLDLVRSCGECPHYHYYSGGSYECKLVGQIVRDKSDIAPFCPLAEYPSKKLADLSFTLEKMQANDTTSFLVKLFMHIASRLKLSVSADYMKLDIPYGNDQVITLRPDAIRGVKVLFGLEVEFVGDDNKKTFVLHLDIKDPVLIEKEYYLKTGEGPFEINHQLTS